MKSGNWGGSQQTAFFSLTRIRTTTKKTLGQRLLCLKCHNRVEFPFTTPQGHRVGRPTKGSYIYQLPPDAVYHPHHLRTTPTVELSNTHTKKNFQLAATGDRRRMDKLKTGTGGETGRDSASRARGACFSSGGNNSIHWVLASCLSEKQNQRWRREKGDAGKEE